MAIKYQSGWVTLETEPDLEGLEQYAEDRKFYLQSGINDYPIARHPKGYYAIALTRKRHARLASKENDFYRRKHDQDEHPPHLKDRYIFSPELSFSTMRRESTFTEGHDTREDAVRAALLHLDDVLSRLG